MLRSLEAFYIQGGTTEQWIYEGKTTIGWTRLSCHLQLHALAYNLANFMRTLVLPTKVEHWSLNTIREKLVKIAELRFWPTLLQP